MSSANTALTTSPRAAKSASDTGIDVAAVLRSMRRRWVPSVLIGVPLAIAGGLAAFFLIPAPYVAVAEIYFKSYDDNLVFETNEPQAQFRTRKETHQRLVTSRDVLTAALRKLDVASLKTFAGVSHPVEWLADQIQVSRAGEEFFTISLSGEEPQEIADIVNAVAGAYMSEVVEDEVVNRRERLAELQRVLSGVDEDLLIQRKQLRDLTEVSNSATSKQAEQRQEHILNMQIEIRKQMTQIDTELVHLKVRQRLKDESGEQEPEASKTTEEIPTDVLQNWLEREPEYATAKSRVGQMKSLLERSQKLYDVGHPKLKSAEAQLANAEKELVETATRLEPTILRRIEAEQSTTTGEVAEQDIPEEIEFLERAKAELEKELDGWKVTEQQSGLYSLDIDAATKELGRLEALSDTLRSELERREFELKNARLPARIIEDAIAPSGRSFKKKFVGVAGAAGGALAFVICGFVFLDMRIGRISTPQEVSKTLDLPLLATLPALPPSAMSGNTSSRRQRQKTVFWTSALKESVDAARTMLLSLAAREELRTILISSAMPGEGKTTLSLHLATSLARSGRRVALIDADLRRPSLSQVYGADGPGLCEIIRGEATLAEVLVPGNIEGLSVLPAGQFDEEVLERAALNGLGNTLTELRETCDFVIVDSSPVLPICDGLLFANQVDGVLLSIRRDVSRRSLVAAALDRFRSVGKPVIGAVAIGLHDDPAGYSEMRRYQTRYGYTRALAEC